MTKVLGIRFIALTKDDQLYPHVHEIGQDFSDQVNALLLHQPGYHSEQRPARFGCQAKFFLNAGLARFFSGQIIGGKMPWQTGIGSGIVVLHINAVEDAIELIVHQIHHTLQAAAEFRAVQFPGVGWRHCGHGVRHQHGPLHQVHILPAFVHVAQTAIVPAPRQAEGVRQLISSELALIGDVVNGVNCFDAIQIFGPGLVVFKVQDGQRRFPIVAVKDLRHEIQLEQDFNHRSAEPGETLFIVVIAVQPRPMEERFVFHKPNDDAVQLCPIQAAGIRSAVEPNGKLRFFVQLLPETLLNAWIQRCDHGDLMPQFFQLRRQRKGHIRQSAGFGKWSALTGDKQDIHALLLCFIYGLRSRSQPGPPFRSRLRCAFPGT